MGVVPIEHAAGASRHSPRPKTPTRSYPRRAEWTRTTTDETVHEALNLSRALRHARTASRFAVVYTALAAATASSGAIEIRGMKLQH
jgi:hypothetical protein